MRGLFFHKVIRVTGVDHDQACRVIRCVTAQADDCGTAEAVAVVNAFCCVQ
jgi:hypothetical protein